MRVRDRCVSIEVLLGIAPQLEFAETRVGDARNSEGDPLFVRSELSFIPPFDSGPALERPAGWSPEQRKA